MQKLHHTYAVAALLLALAATNALAEHIVLTSGEQLNAPIIDRTDESIIIDHPILGELTIALNKVVSIDGVLTGEAAAPEGEAAESGEAPPAEAEQDDEPAAVAGGQPPQPAAPPPPVEKPQWDSKLEIGFNANEGNTEDQNLRIAFTSERETEDNRLFFDASYKLASSNGDRTENRISTGILSEWPVNGEPYSYFAAARFDNAEFQSWDQRITANGGLKYYFIDWQKLDDDGNVLRAFNFAGRIGAGLRKEFGSMDDNIVPEGLLGLDVEWQISPDQSLKASSTYYPELEDPAMFRLVNSVDWVIDINQADGMSLKFGLLHEHQSEVDPGVKRNDLSVYASLVVDF